MNVAVLYGALGFIVLCLLVFIGYYAYRLKNASREAKETAARFEEFSRRQALMDAKLEGSLSGLAPGSGTAGGGLAQDAGGGIQQDPDTVQGAAEEAPGGRSVKTYEEKLNLQSLSDDAVFMKRSETGEVIVQLGEKRPTPLNFMLDPRARHALSSVAMRASVDLGTAWSILAEDDEEGRLRITVIM